jgi:hypothetical protein
MIQLQLHCAIVLLTVDDSIANLLTLGGRFAIGCESGSGQGSGQLYRDRLFLSMFLLLCLSYQNTSLFQQKY